MRRLIGSLVLTGGALCAAGLVYAQQLPPAEAPILAGPDGPIEAPLPIDPAATPDGLEPAIEEIPPGEEATAGAYAPDPVLAREENRASLEVAEEAAEEIDPEDIEPPPPPPPPLRRPRYASAVFMAVDKIAAETLRFEAKVGQPVRYKNLVFTLRACETTAPDETLRDEMAHLEVVSAPKPVTGRTAPVAREVFKGWSFASSPALNPIEHPLYDAWLVGCVDPNAGKPPKDPAKATKATRAT